MQGLHHLDLDLRLPVVPIGVEAEQTVNDRSKMKIRVYVQALENVLYDGAGVDGIVVPSVRDACDRVGLQKSRVRWANRPMIRIHIPRSSSQ